MCTVVAPSVYSYYSLEVEVHYEGLHSFRHPSASIVSPASVKSRLVIDLLDLH